MRVAIDAQLTVGTPTGIGEYLHGLIAALEAQGRRFDVLRDPGNDPWRFDRRLRWDQLQLPNRARGADVLHCAAGTIPFLHRGRVVVTVHDVAWLRVQQHARAYARMYFGAAMLRLYRRADAIMVDSEFSRRELLELGGFDERRVRVVYPGVSEEFFAVAQRRAQTCASAEPVILAVGTVERRKNLEVVIRALARMHRRARLVSIGPPTPYLETCRRLATELGVDARVEFRGFVARADVLDAYETARVAVVPSRYEGFGYGAAQALAAGVPLLVANASSLPEVAGPDMPALPVDDVDAWAEALDAALAYRDGADASTRETARRRFSWERAAREVWECFEASSER